MVLVTSPTKPLQFNVKGLPRRKIILKEYHDEIEACYKKVEDSAPSAYTQPLLFPFLLPQPFSLPALTLHPYQC